MKTKLHIKLLALARRINQWFVSKLAPVQSPMEIFVIMEGGVVHEIVNLPNHINVTVLDYDTEDVEEERLEISPVDGELCVINKW